MQELEIILTLLYQIVKGLELISGVISSLVLVFFLERWNFINQKT